MPPIICIVGTDKTQKKRLMIELIKYLKDRGLRTGALKYHKHGDFEIDIEGKDSWKYTEAGADTVAISSSEKFALIKNENVPIDIDEICTTYFNDCDAVLADGFTLSAKPRIIVVKNEKDAGIFDRGCQIISITKDVVTDLEQIQKRVHGFLNQNLHDEIE